MGRMVAVVAAMAAACSLHGAPVTSAQPQPIDPSCEQMPILGLNPHMRFICDTPIWPDGSWDRFRKLRYPKSVKSSCGGRYYSPGSLACPPWLRDVVPEREVVDSYRVTWQTIPPGEPGHLG